MIGGASLPPKRKALAVLASATMVLAACARGAEPGPDELSATTILPTDRLALPEFDLARFEALLEELRGTPTVVNVWASWCAPCRVEAPGLARLAREFEGRVQFVGVDILDDRESARAFILEFDWPYPSVFDPGGRIRDGLGYIGQPVTILYDREGEVAFEHLGAVTEDLLRREIEKVLCTTSVHQEAVVSTSPRRGASPGTAAAVMTLDVVAASETAESPSCSR